MNYHRGYIESFNATLQHDFGVFNLQAVYVGSLAIRHTDDININASGPGGGVAGQALYPITGQTTAITESLPFNEAKYNSLQTQLTRRLGSAGLLGSLTRFPKPWITEITTTLG